jgi:hypothetical protein
MNHPRGGSARECAGVFSYCALSHTPPTPDQLMISSHASLISADRKRLIIIRIDNRQQYFFPVCIRHAVRFHGVINVISLSMICAQLRVVKRFFLETVESIKSSLTMCESGVGQHQK